jgi:hypothetical protein
MIVFELACCEGHRFEGWFPDSDGFVEQVKSGTVECPVCGTGDVSRVLTAPRISKHRKNGDDRRRLSTTDASTKAFEEAARSLRTQISQNFEDVGGAFPEEARKIHYGETQSRSIFGTATETEAENLREEGVPFCQIPFPINRD